VSGAHPANADDAADVSDAADTDAVDDVTAKNATVVVCGCSYAAYLLLHHPLFALLSRFLFFYHCSLCDF